MSATDKTLRRALRQAGYSSSLLDAALLPDWAADPLADDDDHLPLRRAISRRLGVAGNVLQGERIDFVWDDEARFKTLGATDPLERHILAAFSIATAHLVGELVETPLPEEWPGAAELRAAILRSRRWVDLAGLLSASWALGIPVVHLRLFPLERKAMHAVVAHSRERPVIMLGRDALYPAPLAFTLAHELGHIMLGHLEPGGARIEMGEADTLADSPLEAEANRFALELLTGSERPIVETERKSFNAAMLASATLAASGLHRIEPGTLALVTGYQTGLWPQATAALEIIYDAPREAWHSINNLALDQLERGRRYTDTAYLERLLGREDMNARPIRK